MVNISPKDIWEKNPSFVSLYRVKKSKIALVAAGRVPRNGSQLGWEELDDTKFHRRQQGNVTWKPLEMLPLIAVEAGILKWFKK